MIYDINLSFKEGKIQEAFITDKFIKYTKLWYHPSKFELMTVANFKILFIYATFNIPHRNVEVLLLEMAKFTASDMNKGNQLRSDILSYNYIIERDLRVLETLSLTPYVAYTMNKIHAFTFAWYYKRNLESMPKTPMNRGEFAYKKARVLTDYFKLDQ